MKILISYRMETIIVIIKKVKEKIKEEIHSVRKEVKDKTVGYIITALGLVAGLAWNDAIRSLIEYYFPLSEKSVWAKLIYAAFLTLIVVLISVYLVRIFNKEKRKEGKK
jgi:hypothetical protein